jgi:alkyl hydroperoxide reductase subunit AhpC
MTYLVPDEFEGRWVVLSFVHSLGDHESRLWSRQGKDLAAHGAALLVVPSEMREVQWKRLSGIEPLHFAVAGDPLRRLQRLYGDPIAQLAQLAQLDGRARSFLIDPDGVLRFHLVHSLTKQGMEVLKELLRAHQETVMARSA